MMQSSIFFLLLAAAVWLRHIPVASAFVSQRTRFRSINAAASHHPQVIMHMAISDAARDLLYQDQQEAMLRRSLVEEELLAPASTLLKAPKLKAQVQRGTGFAASQKSSPQALLATQQAKSLKREGVLLVENVLSSDAADQLRDHVLEQQQLAQHVTLENPSKSRSFYGVEQARANRCDLQLSLLRGGYKADSGSDDGESPSSSQHVLADALQEILGTQGSLRSLYENLVTLQGEFYELAAVVTHPGSKRQIIHPDLPFQTTPPLYVVFLALQDVTEDMGPTSFLLRTHTASQNRQFTSGDEEVKNAQLTGADCRLSCLSKGDAVIFDARILHCGNANASEDKARALFNFSFRNPKATGSLGYEGSMRPGYCKAMSLADVSDALVAYEKGNPDPFANFGSGLL